MSVSVVIPTYNCGRWVVEAVESALGQTVPPAQVIVVDDGSTDDTAERLAPLVARGVEYVHQANTGVSAARNEGVRRAMGEYVAFLDADDVWHPRKLEFQLQAMRECADLALLGTETFNWPDDPARGELERGCVRRVLYTELLIRNAFTTSSVVVRCSVVRACGNPPFDTQLQGPEDHDLWIRIASSWPTAVLTSPLTGYRRGVSSLGNQPGTMKRGMTRILKKLGDSGAWRGVRGRLLRQKAYAYRDHSCAMMHAASGAQLQAIRNTLSSLLHYPLPLGRRVTTVWAARPRLAVIALLRLLRLRPDHSGAVAPTSC